MRSSCVWRTLLAAVVVCVSEVLMFPVSDSSWAAEASIERVAVTPSSETVAVTSPGREYDEQLRQAAEPDAPVVQMDPVVVTATRGAKHVTQVPGAVTVVDQKQILQGRPATGVDEALRIVPGVQAERRFGPDSVRISIRGSGIRATFGVRSIRVLLDGIPLTKADGQTSVQPVDLDAVSRVEVLRGPNSTLYGNTSAGVVNYVLEEGDQDNRYAESRFVFGSYDLNKYRLKAAGGTDRFSYMITASYFNASGYRNLSQTYSGKFTGKFKYAFDSRSDLSFLMTFTRYDAFLPGNLTMTQFRTNPRQAQQTRHSSVTSGVPGLYTNAPYANFFPTIEFDRLRTALTYRNEFAAHQEISLTGFFGTQDLDHPKCCFPGDYDTGFLIDHYILAKYTNTMPIFGRPNRLILGYDYQHENATTKDFQTLPGQGQGPMRSNINERQIQDGIYVQDELTLFDRVELTGGIRYSQVGFKETDNLKRGGIDASGQRFFSATTPMVGLRYSPVEWANLYFNISTSFETPTSSEFRNPTTSVGQGLNPNLQPQKSTNYEVGMKGAVKDWLSYDLAVYRQHFTNEFIPFSLPTGPCTIFSVCFRNAGRSDHDGVELGLAYRPVRSLTFQMAYTYADYRFRDYVSNGVQLAGRRLPGIPEHRIVLDLTYERLHGKLAGLYAGAEWQYQTAYFLSDTNDQSVPPGGGTPANDRKNPGYTVTSLKAGYKGMVSQHWGIELFTRLENLFDANYALGQVNPQGRPAFQPYPGRQLFGGFGIRYQY